MKAAEWLSLTKTLHYYRLLLYMQDLCFTTKLKLNIWEMFFVSFFFVRSMILFLVVLLLGWVLVCRRHVVGTGGRDVSGVGVVGVVPAKGIKNLRFWVEDLEVNNTRFPLQIIIKWLSLHLNQNIFLFVARIWERWFTLQENKKKLCSMTCGRVQKNLFLNGVAQKIQSGISPTVIWKLGVSDPSHAPPYRVAKI